MKFKTIYRILLRPLDSFKLMAASFIARLEKAKTVRQKETRLPPSIQVEKKEAQLSYFPYFSCYQRIDSCELLKEDGHGSKRRTCNYIRCK